MKIYTRTGDKGKTSLFSNQRVWKNSKRVSAYGSLDELNSLLGVVLSNFDNGKEHQKHLAEIIKIIQNDLFYVGSSMADINGNVSDIDLKNRTLFFEKKIDEMSNKMPKLSSFIIPGGGKTGALLHFARSVSRRAEREIVALFKEEKIDENIIQYINRLSDLFFTMARFANYKERKKEIIWKK
ncbi:MAG: ATP:cob(I)alamin adenosyltransferase [Candidatus Levybacteria bacterium RIFCSPLOWO2_01_FULL_36_10]|nr:MAG: ATP:cob(I)alamin adenosyltransferase [Candidatus Levybacteria bacterium RIFCSPLOWO2_01_FULL_36_10]